jgi:signal transduction histidine kinase
MTMARVDVSETMRRRIGRSFALISVALSGAGAAVLAALWGWDALVRTDAISFALLGIGFGVLTWILVTARADNGAVWALAWAALFSSLFTAGLALAVLSSRGPFPGLTLDQLRELSPAELPLPAAIALHFRFWAVVPALWLPLTFGLLLFPDGHLPSPRWRFVAWWSASAIAVATVATAWVHNPWSTLPVKAAEDTVDSRGGALIDLAFLSSSIAAFVCAVSLVVRYRRSSGPTRGQIRWIGWGGGVYIVVLTVGDSLTGFVGNGLLSDLLGVAAFMLLIACWGVAITRHRLFDIDVVVSKSVTYLGLAAVITVLYAAVVVGPLLVVGRSNEGDPGLVLPIVATALVAVVFEPIRARMQRWANRLVFGERATPHEVLSKVTATLSEAPLGAGTGDLARLLAEGTGAAEAVVWLRDGDRFEPEGLWSKGEGRVIDPVSVDGLVADDFCEWRPVSHRAQLFGALSVTKARNDPVTPADRQLLADVAAGAGLLLRNISLNRELVQRAAEVRQSRRRLIAAQDAERHRLERDLHDGAQQQVVALKVKLGIARTIAGREGAEEIASLVSVLAEETQRAVDALRTVAHGIYPPLLESEGLAAALLAVVRSSSIPLVVDAPELGRYDRSVEQTVYFCVLETLERARLAGAGGVRVGGAERNDAVVVEVELDGAVDDLDLTAVTDRVDAVGGTVVVDQRNEHRTRITSSIPAIRSVPAERPTSLRARPC